MVLGRGSSPEAWRLFACAAIFIILTAAHSTAGAAPEIVPPKRLDDTSVPYPPGAAGDASVTLVVVIDRNGDVTDVTVREGSPPFADAAIAGVRTWRFAPATKDDAPIPSRIVANVTFHAPPPPAPPATVLDTVPAKIGYAAPVGPPVDVAVKGEREEPSTIHIPRTETRVVAGAFGDPLKIVEALPGMAPWTNGLPYYYVRGAPPENVGYFVDGIRVPLLFHVGPGPSTLAPALVDSVDLFPGAYPARYGRYAGAVIAAETTPPQTDHPHGEFAARIYDSDAFVETPWNDGRGTVAVGGRYGYTGLITSIIVPDYTLGYWDYQLRVSHRVGENDTVSVFAFGAHDELHYRGQPTFRVDYHRVDLRYDHPLPGGNIRVAGTYSYDNSLTALQTNTGAGANADLEGPGGRLRTEIDERFSHEMRLRAGADVSVTHYAVDSYPMTSKYPATSGAHTDIEGGLYADVVWRPWKPLELTPGIRFDGYDSRGQTTWAPQPRLSTRLQITSDVAWLSALGVAHQEPTEEVLVPSSIPSPLDQGSQTIYQFSEGAEVRLPLGVRLRATGFYSRVVATRIRGTAASEEGESGGFELFLQRDFSKRLGGFLSYTLSRTVGLAGGVTERASWDRTHVLSLVLGYDLGNNWRVGTRLFLESGRPQALYCDNCLTSVSGELPPFWRVDFRLEKKWSFRGGQWLTGTLECFNLFDRAEATDAVDLPGQGIVPNYQSAIILPSIGLEGGF